MAFILILASHVFFGMSSQPDPIVCSNDYHLLFKRDPTEEDVEQAVACLMEPIKKTLGFVGDLAVVGGGVGGVAAGAKAGALAGTVVGGPLGATVGGIVGGIAGLQFGVGAGTAADIALRKAAELLRRNLEAFLKWLLVSGDEEFCRALETLDLDCADDPPCTIVHSAWKTLVFRHHPDRWHGASREEKAEKELLVTKYNLAWELALDRFGGLASCHGDL